MNKPKTLVIGGTGYLGRYIIDALQLAGHQVSALSRSKSRAKQLLPRGVRILEGDIHTTTPVQWRTMLGKHHNLVFAAGVDERVPPEGDPTAFYHHENVTRVKPILEAAAAAGVERVALLNSVFSTLDRSRPEIGLAAHHPYIASRVAQREMALDVAKGNFIMSVLEIPWVFGDARGAESQWRPLVQFARTTPRLFAPRGGTVVISAANVGRATAGALSLPKRSSAAPIGDLWMTWDGLLSGIAAACGREAVPIQRIPDRLLVQFNELSGIGQKLFRLQSGLDYGRMHEFLLDDQPINLKTSQRKFGYAPDDVAQAFAETASNVPESRAIAAVRKLMS